ncbi:MAG: hypothetical protein GX166_10680 [Clostridiaceae bacterium]|nr:hypothetical protein [Clostridiaceae bacterium]
MENCNFCKHKSVNTIGGGFLCRIHGPMSWACVCREFERDETKIKGIKCKDCLFFRRMESLEDMDKNEDSDVWWGTCKKYLLRKFDGNSRQTCSQFVEKSQKYNT